MTKMSSDGEALYKKLRAIDQLTCEAAVALINGSIDKIEPDQRIALAEDLLSLQKERAELIFEFNEASVYGD